jgi:hypothetical protein
VPVSVDAIRTIDNTPMARVTYFIVTSVVPEPGWLIRAGMVAGTSLQVLGLMGVICRPGSPGLLFAEPHQIAELFELIEANPGLSVESEDLWIPTSWFPGPDDPEPGEVYRVDLPLFQATYRFRAEALSQNEFLETAPWEGTISFSPSETAAFQAWAKAQIEESRTLYPKDPQLELGYTEDDAPWEGQ